MIPRGLLNAQRRTEYFPFGGGLDLVTPVLSMKPGFCREAMNYECSNVNGGYSRIKGYERFDGRDKPSDATYTVLPATITGSPAVGDTLTGATSLATGEIIAIVTGAGGYFVLTAVSGAFQDAEALNVSATPVATADSDPVTNGAATMLLDAQYKNLAADYYRGLIGAVPGSGSVLGVKGYNGKVYAFRANAGGTAVDLHKSSGSGWTQVPLGYELAFTSGGNIEIVEGSTITGAVSGATAVLTRVLLESGSWAAGTAAGRLIFASQTGAFQAEDLNIGATLNVATIAGNSSPITLAAGGRFEFVLHNFGGSVNTLRMYGCDGVNRAFEFDSDGDVFVPIRTGMPSDAPHMIAAHKNHLFLAFESSVQHSGIGTPYQWTIISGAGELALGDRVTGLKVQSGNESGGALLIATRNRLSVLYGSDSTDWNLVTYSEEAGAFAYTLQTIAVALMLDDRGITGLNTTSAFGNFAQATLSRLVRPWLNDRKGRQIASCIVREKDQYRLFFTDSYALYVTMSGQKVVGMMPVLFNEPVTCIASDEWPDGSEQIYFGSTDGYVYQLDVGTSFDGDEITHYIGLPYHHSGSPVQRKRYRSARFEMSGEGYFAFECSFELGYSSPDIPTGSAETVAAEFGEGDMDTGVWDSGVWDGRSLVPAEIDLTGTGENISLRVQGSSDYMPTATFNGVVLQWSPRRSLR